MITLKNNLPVEIGMALISLLFLIPDDLAERDAEILEKKTRLEKLEILENKTTTSGMTSNEKAEVVSSKLKIAPQDLLELNGVMIPLKFDGFPESHEKETVTFALQSILKKSPDVEHQGIYPGQSNSDSVAKILKCKNPEDYQKSSYNMIPEFVVNGLSGEKEAGISYLRISVPLQETFIERGEVVSRSQREELDTFLQRVLRENEDDLRILPYGEEHKKKPLPETYAKRGKMSDGKLILMKDPTLVKDNRLFSTGGLTKDPASWGNAVADCLDPLKWAHRMSGTSPVDFPTAEKFTSYSKILVEDHKGKQSDGILAMKFLPKRNGGSTSRPPQDLDLLYYQGKWWVLITKDLKSIGL